MEDLFSIRPEYKNRIVNNWESSCFIFFNVPLFRQNYALAMSSPIIYATIASTFIAWNHVGHNDLVRPSYLWRKIPLRGSFIFEQVLSLRLFSLSNVFSSSMTHCYHLQRSSYRNASNLLRRSEFIALLWAILTCPDQTSAPANISRAYSDH